MSCYGDTVTAEDAGNSDGKEESITCWPPHAQEDAELTGSQLTACVVTSSAEPVTSEGRRSPAKQGPRNIHTVDVALARWWRQEGRALHMAAGAHTPSGGGGSAHTAIHAISKCKEGARFMMRECRRLRGLTRSYPSSAELHVALATFLEKVGEFDDAEEHIRLAIGLQADRAELSEYKWLMERISRQIQARQMQEQKERELKLTRPLAMPEPAQVERREAKSLSVEEFYHTYAITSTPLVITGLVGELTSTPWDLQHVRHTAGTCKVTLKKLDQSSVEWARLESTETTTVAQYIDGLANQEALAVPDKRYLFDWSLPINCPRLAEQLMIPKYFAGDFLQRTAPGSLYRDSWPSLFVAPPGLRSDLHVDAFGSNFWMAMFEGSKRWLFFEKEDVPLLYPQYPHSMDPVFRVDLTRPDLAQFPLLSMTHPKECVLQAGDVLFVPAGCPHMVTNEERSLAISANFVDASNFGLVKQELEVNSLVDERASDLLRQFKSEIFESDMDFGIQHTPRTAQGNSSCHHVA